MKVFFGSCGKLVALILRTETSSLAGRVNLLGGFLILSLGGVFLIDGVLSKVTNFFLILFGKTPQVTAEPTQILFFLVTAFIYFVFCVSTIVSQEKLRARRTQKARKC
jgi:hypothetical protein